jgi:radical SAM-linked protein
MVAVTKEVQRLRVTFSRREEVKYITHLDLARCWERLLRRAEVHLAYSTGFSPHPRISIASPLSLGVTSEAELMDVFLARRTSPHSFLKKTGGQLPPGIDILEVQEVLLGVPSLQSKLEACEYLVNIGTDKSQGEIKAAIDSLMQAEQLPWQHMRDTGPRRYDLRALIEDIQLMSWEDSNCTLGMRLKSGAKGSGRPEQVALALGFTEHPTSIHRTKLFLADR